MNYAFGNRQRLLICGLIVAGGPAARAALIAASYTTLVTLFSTQKAQLDDSYAASLASLVDDSEGGRLGIDYGTTVAKAVLHWRSSDGFSTPIPAFTGGTSVGQWRPTPPAQGAMSAQPLAFTQDFVAGSSQFRPPAPRDLLGATYTKDTKPRFS